ncbi:hypothetical protein CAPTEDRAFT_143957, partial [Capitella teleta]
VPSGIPKITTHPHRNVVEKDQNTIMVCSASGNPEPHITWFKDSIPVDLTDPRLTLLESGTLHIRESNTSDEGLYECMAENELGSAYSYPGQLTVYVRGEGI